jgi:hypothetical protein
MVLLKEEGVARSEGVEAHFNKSPEINDGY